MSTSYSVRDHLVSYPLLFEPLSPSSIFSEFNFHAEYGLFVDANPHY